MTALILAEPRATERWTALRPVRWRLKRRHVLMLALAAEVLVFGARGAERYRPPGILVDVPMARGHVIT